MKLSYICKIVNLKIDNICYFVKIVDIPCKAGIIKNTQADGGFHHE